MSKDKKAFFGLLSLIFMFIGIIFAFNKVIDPVGTSTFISNKYKPLLNERYQKNKILSQSTKFDTYVLGSSSSMQVKTDPNLNFQSYNFSLSNITMMEVSFLINKITSKPGVKRIFWGIDLANFNYNYDPLKGSVETSFEQALTLSPVSIQSSKLSIKTLKNKVNDTPQNYFESDGTLVYAKKNQMIKNDPKSYFSEESFSQSAKDNFNFLYRQKKTRFIYNHEILEVLKKIKEQCEKTRTNLYLYLPPIHKRLRELILKNEDTKIAFTRYKKDLLEVFPSFTDFTIDNKFTQDRRNFYDPAHPNRETAKKMVSEMINYNQSREPIKSFGQFIKKESL